MKNWILKNIPLAPELSRSEELLNGFSHLLGALATVPGGYFLLRRALSSGNHWYVISGGIFIFSMCMLYTASACYHLVRGPLVKRIARVFDHASIYILIAGTYTPIAFKIWEPWGVVILSLIWGMALGGFIVKLFFWGRLKVLHVLFYLGMGWVIVLFWSVFTQRVDPGFITWTIFGGLSYTVGVIFYAIKRIPYNHAIWHLFVLTGSIAFYLGIYFYVIV